MPAIAAAIVAALARSAAAMPRICRAEMRRISRDPLVVEPVVPGAQEGGQAERPDLFGGIAAGQQAGQVAALAVARGHDDPEMVERAPPAAAGQPAGDQRQQRHRHQQRRHREQRHRRADRAGHRTREPLQPEHHLRRAHHPRLRPRDPVVELRLVEGGQLDRAGHVEDPVLGVARGEFGQHPLLLAQYHPDQAQYRRDDAEQRGARPDAGQAGARVLGDQDRLQHAPAHHHLGRDRRCRRAVRAPPW